VDELQRTYQISVAGPTTFSALLNSLRMGFRTLAIQKHSNEVWEVLGAVKTEFGKFSDALVRAQQRITQTGDELEKLVGTRTNAINRKLRAVSAELTVEDSKKIIDAVADSVEE
jgi:DNA recombination protein RmuC